MNPSITNHSKEPLNRFDEWYEGRTGLTLGVQEVVFSKQSPFQLVEVLHTDSWGHVLTLDGLVMLSEQDEFVYHEMLTHPALCAHPKPSQLCVIGGGDGGTIRECCKHEDVESIDWVEIDEVVIEASKACFPGLGVFDDPRASLYIEDGIKFVERQSAKYDVILIDGSDPIGPAEGLFGDDFVQACAKALKPGGIVVSQSESPWVKTFHPNMKTLYHALSSHVGNVSPYLCSIPLYPTGTWSMMMASNEVDPQSSYAFDSAEQFCESHPELKYFSADVFRASQALPPFVAALFQSSAS
ncbi:MAG: polyamine aminopropyltransferase [Bacteroidetes bacterium]|nr:polyamine aminopropyltransferase [Bacteroidota bacterium]